MKRLLPVVALLLANTCFGAVPLSTRFNADPSPHFVKGERGTPDMFYLYATDDASNSGKYWDSTSWRLYSSRDMEHWRDDGAFLNVSVFKWARPDAKAWAPEMAQRNGRFYFYAPVGGDKIGVAVAQSPAGPFVDARGTPLVDKGRDPNAGDEPIDPQVFVDDDGRAYMVFGTRVPKMVQLERDMITTTGPISDIVINGLPSGAGHKGYGEAPFLHKHGGSYYFSFSTGWPGQIVYATSSSAAGPFTYRGVILDYLPISTNHQAVLEHGGRSWLFYHDNLLPGGGDYRRSIAITPLTYGADGAIEQVKP